MTKTINKIVEFLQLFITIPATALVFYVYFSGEYFTVYKIVNDSFEFIKYFICLGSLILLIKYIYISLKA